MEKKWTVGFLIVVVELLLVAAVAGLAYIEYNPQTAVTLTMFVTVAAASALVASLFTTAPTRRVPQLVASALRMAGLTALFVVATLYVGWGTIGVLPLGFVGLVVGGWAVALLAERILWLALPRQKAAWRLPAEVRDEARRAGLMAAPEVEPLLRPHWRAMRRAFDIVVSATLLLTLFPLVYFFVFITTKARRRGDVLEVVPRVGPDGRPVRAIRFRSAGRLNAMPGLLNVLRGDITLVGPRLMNEEEASAYLPLIEPYPVRRVLKAGLRGFGRPEAADGVALTLRFSAHWNLWLDLQALVCRPK